MSDIVRSDEWYEPLTCVALGAGRVLEEMKTLKNVLIDCGESL
jgi:actin-like ATPase involved in cell morphogenesis